MHQLISWTWNSGFKKVGSTWLMHVSHTIGLTTICHSLWLIKLWVLDYGPSLWVNGKKTLLWTLCPLKPIDLVREPFRVLNTNNQSWKKNKNKSESGLSFRNKKSSKLSTPKIQNFTTSAIFIGQSLANMLHCGHSSVYASPLDFRIVRCRDGFTGTIIRTEQTRTDQNCNHADFTLYWISI